MTVPQQDIFNTSSNFYIHKDIIVETKYFIAYRYISILNKIDKLVEGDFFISLENDSSGNTNIIGLASFQQLIKTFPNTTETFKYTNLRIEYLLEDFITLRNDSRKDYNQYIEKKNSYNLLENQLLYEINKHELEKYKVLLTEIKNLLGKTYISEKVWQKKILPLLLFIFPKYICI